MKHRNSFIVALVVILLAASSMVEAAQGNWKKGRIYYRMVCTQCHIENAGGAISPSEKTT